MLKEYQWDFEILDLTFNTNKKNLNIQGVKFQY